MIFTISKDLVYKWLSVDDMPTYPILPLFDEAIKFIDEARIQGGVLVHWFAPTPSPLVWPFYFFCCFDCDAF